jgi:hypothetical protein
VSATSAERLLILLDALVYKAANVERGHDLSGMTPGSEI